MLDFGWIGGHLEYTPRFIRRNPLFSEGYSVIRSPGRNSSSGGPDRRDRRCPPESFPARRYAPPRMGPSLEPDAEDQDRLKSELVATVSHEMRRPLTAILGFAQTLRTRWDTLPSQLRGELLERVELNAQAMSHMIGQVLDFSRLQLGQFPIELRPLEVEPLVARVLGNLGSQIAGHVVRTRGENDVRVLTEPYAFERILGNLVMNAAKFAPAGTTIEVGWTGESEETVRLWVRDEGPGVPEPDRERIFDRFYRVEH